MANQENFTASYFYDLLEGQMFYDEDGAVIESIKVKKSDSSPILYCKPKIVFDLFPEGLKPRVLRYWDSNFDSRHLERLGYCVVGRTVPIMNRWLPKIRVQYNLFPLHEIPKSEKWKEITRIPEHHKVEIDEANMQIRLIGACVNERGYTDWFKIMVPPEYQEYLDAWKQHEKEVNNNEYNNVNRMSGLHG